ncbi:MAG: major facilitator superfamily 1 [Firmicutes bacterium]|nr:major facilitator superfamily 1 [Bacillota bacterium]
MNQVNTEIQKRTPFGRLVSGIVLGQFGYIMATIVPLVILLTFKFLEIDPQNVTADFSMATGAGALVGIIAAYIGGVVSDRTTVAFGRRRTWILLGTVLAAVAMVGIGKTSTVGMVIVLWCVALTFYAFSFAALSALVPDQVEEAKRGTASGIVGLCNPIAILVGMGVMTALNNQPVDFKFTVLAVISVICAVVSCILVKEEKPIAVKEENFGKTLTFGEWLGRIYPNPRKYPAFSWGVLTRFLVCLAFATQVFGALYFMQKFNVSPADVTGIAALNALVQTVGLGVSSIVGGMLSDKFRKQKPFVSIAAIVVAIGIVIMAFAPSIPVAFIGTAVLGIGYGAYIAVDMALISRILPNPKDAAKDFGIMNVASQLPQSILPVFAPLLIGAGGFPLFFGLLAIAGLLSAVAVAPIPEVSSAPEK